MIIAIIQARMGSTRLPGKVIKEVLGKPLIGYLLERVSKSKYIDQIILATTTNKDDDILEQYVSSLDYEVFRGSENDVLSRYYHAYDTLCKDKDKLNGIVRITGDCPLFESENCDMLIDNFMHKDLDYNFLSPKFAEGLDCEIFSSRLLVEAYDNAKLKSEREHVTQYFHNNKDKYKIEAFDKIIDDSKYRITVDEPEDFLVVENIIKHFYESGITLNFDNIKKYLDDNSDIFSLNSSIIRNEGLAKSLDNDSEI